MIVFTRAVIVAFSYLTFGWVLQQLWGWFIVPEGIRPISLGEAVLLRAVLFLLVRDASDPVAKRKSDGDKMLDAFVYTAVLPATLWLLGWAVKTYVWAV